MGIDTEKAVSEIMKYLDDGVIPEAYIRYLIEDEADVCESQAELTGDVKMRLCEESGIDFPLTRDEAEEYNCDEYDDEEWEQISSEGVVSARLLKTIEESGTSSIYELIKTMPLIPAAKMVTAIVMKHLAMSGVELSTDDIEQLSVDVTRDLDSPFDDLMDPYDEDDEDYDDDDEDYDDDDEDDVDEDDMMAELERILSEDPKVMAKRRSRITQFPGRKS